MQAGLDTIVAIATPRGRAALAVVRLSGPDAIGIADGQFPSKSLAAVPSHTAYVGPFVGASGERLDQVVMLVYRAPSSPTGEDVVEISCHGGDVAPQLIVRALLERRARLARPGEFTERAFLNGKLDLAQAEAVADLIHARSTLAHRISLNHLEGRYSAALEEVRQELLQLCALVELELDFSEEDVEFAGRDELDRLLDRATRLLDRLLGSYRLGALVRDGVRVVIGGRPNAGKSTLLNALLGEDRVIVSEIPGTTRDAIEAETEIDGVAFRFVDTAGLRDTEDTVEAEGVRRARTASERADVLIYLLDASRGLDEDEREWLLEIGKRRPDQPIVIMANKADLLNDASGVDLPAGAIRISARDATRDPSLLDPLRGRLASIVRADQADPESAPIVVSERHRQHLVRARLALNRARAALLASRSGDLLAPDLRAALSEIGAVTGDVTNEDILDAIFSRFCIGK
jgi:tRNA modification GTPase